MLERFRRGLARTRQRLAAGLRRLVGRGGALDENSLETLEEALIGADFGVELSTRIIGAVRGACRGEAEPRLAALVGAAREEVLRALGPAPARFCVASRPAVVFLVGVNGSGKTTTAAKLAARLKGEGHSVLLAACDTFRAAAIEQLSVWAERLNVPITAGQYRADPAAVLFEALARGRREAVDYVLCDTAGRLHTKHNLMAELEKLRRVAARQIPGAPHEVLLVLDANTGVNTLVQAREFHRVLGVTGIVLAKLDGTAKGGTVVGVQQELGLPVRFVGVGEGPDDLEPFDPQSFAQALFPEDGEEEA